MSNKWKAIFALSIILNLWFLYGWFNQPTVRYGVLTRDVIVPVPGTDKKIVFPQGLVVKDASPQGISSIGQFYRNRFSIIVTSDFKMVDYNVDAKALHHFLSMYISKDPSLNK